MSDERGLAIHLAYLDSAHKFDHFLLGASLAGCAYLAQTNPFGRIGYNIETMYLISLCTLALSAYGGFRRLEAVLALLRVNAKYLEVIQAMSPADQAAASQVMNGGMNRTSFWARVRNGFLYGGFIAYVGTKVFATYLQP